MSDAESHDDRRRGRKLDERFDQVCDEFESAWAAGSRPKVDRYLLRLPEPQREDLFRELLGLEVDYRADLGESIDWDDYRERFPQWSHVVDDIRRQAGSTAAPMRTIQETASFTPDSSQGAASQRRAAKPPADTFGDYELLSEIARGGMGVVYKARQLSLNRTVALKMILSGQRASHEDVARFHTEAEAAANLDHPNIVPIHEVGQHEGQYYLSMGFVEGESLSARLAEGPLAVAEAAELTMKVCQAIAYAHQQGVIHRDLKPANILLDSQNSPRVTDFGLAKRIEGGSELTATGQILGTPSYMSPEQAAGEADKIGPATDVYALGAVLYALVTGRPPFQSDKVLDTLLQVMQREPVSPRLLNPKVARDLETICLKCLEKDPRHRYQRADELAAELGRWLGGEPIQARRASGAERLMKWARRRPAVAGLLVASVAAMFALGGSLVGAFFNAQLRDSLNQTELARQAAEEANRRAEIADYYRRIALAGIEWRDGNVARVEPLLDGCPENYRQWEWNYLKRLCHQDLLTIDCGIGPVYSVAYSPDGTWIAAAGGSAGVGEVVICDATTGDIAVRVKGNTRYFNTVAFSPDGQWIASSGMDKTVRIWNATSGEELLTFKNQFSTVRGVAFSPDGTMVAVVSWSGGAGGSFAIWDLTTGAEVRNIAGETVEFSSVAFSPDGHRIATGGGGKANRGKIQIWDTATGAEVITLDGHSNDVHSVVFSASGKSLASAGADQTVKVWDVKAGQALFTLPHDHTVDCVAFSPDDQRIASCGWSDQTIKLWDTSTGQRIFTLRGHVAGVTSVAFSPDRKTLASCSIDGTVKIWDATTDKTQRILTGHPDAVCSVAFSPEGKRLASGNTDAGGLGEVRIWDITTGSLEFTRDVPGFTSVAYKPDGTQIATASWDTTVQLRDTASGELVRQLAGQHTDGIFDVVFSPSGRQLASAGHDGIVILWDAVSGEKIHKLEDHSRVVTSVAFSPDGKQIASCGDRSFSIAEVKIWDVATGKKLLDLGGDRGGRFFCVAFSPDGKRLAAGNVDGTISVWDATTGEKTLTLKGHLLIATRVAFSPDGKRLASASNDRTVRIWDLTTGQEALSLKGHTGVVYSVAFSPDGCLLTSVSEDRTIRIWDATPLER